MLVGVVRAGLRQRHPLAGAQQLDQFHGLAGRVSNAVAFATLPARDDFMQAAIVDAERFAAELSPRKAVPLSPPRTLLLSCFLALAAYGLSLLEVQHTRLLPTAVNHFVPAVVEQDDIELLRAMNRELEERSLEPDTAALVRQFNQLITDVAERRLDRKQIFDQLERMERGLVSSAQLDAESLEEGLHGLAQQLNQSRLSKPAAAALEQKNLADAEAALKELAKKLKEPGRSQNKAELERLRKALAAASTSNTERNARLEATRQALENERRRLLKKKGETGALNSSDQAATERNDRELKRLNRQRERANRTAEQFSDLDRELAKAAEALRKELGDAAKNLESSGERLGQIAKQQLSNQDKEALKKQIEEMREMLRQSKQGGKQRQQMLEQFRRRAGGKQGQDSGSKQATNGGQQGQPGSGKGPPQLSFGQGQSLEVPGAQGAGGSPGSGSGHGDGSSGDPAGKATAQTGKTKDVSAAGVDTGEGTAASEVVFGAAERGFVGNGYKKVYTDYRTVAEETLTSDQVPPGYKFFVRRYFQLIRPRD
jgi:hypothetical protein